MSYGQNLGETPEAQGTAYHQCYQEIIISLAQFVSMGFGSLKVNTTGQQTGT